VFSAPPITHYNGSMFEPLSVRKEVIVKEDGRVVILYSFVAANVMDKSPQGTRQG
jgi:hypothetical protein